MLLVENELKKPPIFCWLIIIAKKNNKNTLQENVYTYMNKKV